jgi:hypothetical protein
MRLLVLIFTAAVSLAQAVHDPPLKPSGHKLEIKPGPTAPGQPVETPKEPGDDVHTAPDGALVATSRSRSFPFPLTNRMEPIIHVSYRMSNGTVEYDYVVSNGPEAHDEIGLFEFHVTAPAQVSVPAPWKAQRIAIPNAASKIGFYRFVKDRDLTGRLSPGNSLQSLRVVSPALPGLVEAVFHPNPLHAPTMRPEANHFLEGASPWVQQQLSRLDIPERHLLRKLVIGPAVPLGVDSFERIRQDIRSASQSPEFRPSLQAQRLPDSPAALEIWLKEQGTSPARGLLDEFVNAMIWRLHRLKGPNQKPPLLPP